MIKFNKLISNCYFLELNKTIVLISYESIIGLIYKNVLYISEFYLNYSVTTNKHINLFKKNLNYSEIKTISNNDLYLMLDNIEITNLKEILK